jgi:hypothetical protein
MGKKMTATEYAKAGADAVSDALRGFAKQAAFMRKITDSEYWVCACFRDRTQRNEFLKLVGANDKYIDGEKLIERLRHG